MRIRGKGLIGGIVLGAGAAYTYHLMEQRRRAGSSRYVRGVSFYGAREGDIAGLEAASLHGGSPGAGVSPITVRRVIGGALVLYGLARRGRLGTAVRRVGFGLLVRGGRPRRASRQEEPEERRRIVDVQKSFYVDAPVDQVYTFWRNYENFPLFMSHVLEVHDLGEGRSRWRVRGPGGAPIRWQARLTEDARNETIAWRSEPGAMLDHAGVVRFRPEGGGTWVDLRFCYRPPARGAGRAVMALLGADPRAKMNEDIGRLKALLEATVQSEG